MANGNDRDENKATKGKKDAHPSRRPSRQSRSRSRSRSRRPKEEDFEFLDSFGIPIDASQAAITRSKQLRSAAGPSAQIGDGEGLARAHKLTDVLGWVQADWSFDQHMTGKYAVPVGGGKYEVQLEGNFCARIATMP